MKQQAVKPIVFQSLVTSAPFVVELNVIQQLDMNTDVDPSPSLSEGESTADAIL